MGPRPDPPVHSARPAGKTSISMFRSPSALGAASRPRVPSVSFVFLVRYYSSRSAATGGPTLGPCPPDLQGSSRCPARRNPSFLLVEVSTSSGSPTRGDPASALLEVRDPDQNARHGPLPERPSSTLSEVLFNRTAQLLLHPRPWLEPD